MSTADLTPEMDTTSGVREGYDPLSSIMVDTAQELYASLAQQKIEDKVLPQNDLDGLSEACVIKAGTDITSFGNKSGILDDVSEHIRKIVIGPLGKDSILTPYGAFNYEHTPNGVDIYTPDGKCGLRFDKHGNYTSKLMEIRNIYPPDIWEGS